MFGRDAVIQTLSCATGEERATTHGRVFWMKMMQMMTTTMPETTPTTIQTEISVDAEDADGSTRGRKGFPSKAAVTSGSVYGRKSEADVEDEEEEAESVVGAGIEAAEEEEEDAEMGVVDGAFEAADEDEEEEETVIVVGALVVADEKE